MSRLYRNAPLIEAICEVRFDRQSAWDLAVPGLVYEKLKDIYPNRQQFGVKSGPEGFNKFLGTSKHKAVSPRSLMHPQMPLTTEADILEFSNETGSELIRVGENVISIHHIGQYPGWSKLSPRIHKAIDSYVEVADPKNIERIGLRFVNRIQIPGAQAELRDYFHFYPHVGEELPQTFMGFTVSVDFPFDDKTVLRIRHAAQGGSDSEIHASRLDLDYFNSRANSIELKDTRTWLQVAHKRIGAVFESAITNKLRAIFDEVTHD